MINKIFKYNSYDVYYQIEKISNRTPNTYVGIVIKSNDRRFIVGHDYFVYPGVSTELTEEQFNKIVVFE